MNKAVFIDKDGTLIKDVPYNIDTDMIQFENNAFEGLQILQQNNFLLLVVSNQSGVALGYFTEFALQKVFDHIKNAAGEENIAFKDLYYCPHYINGTVSDFSFQCDCRKPAPGMLLKAASDHQIDLAGSWMIGDILNDVEAGNKAGCKTILINNGNETEWEITDDARKPLYMAKDLKHAAEIIVRSKN